MNLLLASIKKRARGEQGQKVADLCLCMIIKSVHLGGSTVVQTNAVLSPLAAGCGCDGGAVVWVEQQCGVEQL